MGRPKSSKLNREEKLKKKRLDEKKRYQKIKNDPVLYAEYQRKNKEKYRKRKEEKKVLPISEMSPRQQRIQRKKWRISFKKHYDKKKEERNKLKMFMECDSPPQSDSENSIQDGHEINDSNSRKSPYLTSPENPVASTSGKKSPSSPISTPTSRLRKLRYKKDKHIEFLKTQLDSVKKMNTEFKKQISQLKCSKTGIQIQDKQKELSEGLVQSFKGLKTHSAKQSLSDALEEHVKLPLKAKRSMGSLRIIFRNKTRKVNEIKKNKEEVKKFLEDDENSCVAAGMKEYVKRGGIKFQKRYLNDSLYNLHKKFLQHNAIRISYATFCRFRPFWIFPASKKRSEKCLCILHENFLLMVTALHRGKIIKANDDTAVLKEICCDIYSVNCLLRKCLKCKNLNISYKEFDNSSDFFYWGWKTQKEKSSTEKFYKIIKKDKIQTTPKEAIASFENMLTKFLNHCGKIRAQRNAITSLKENLSPNEAIIHVDFSENYKCQYAREIQAVHFGGNKSQISLHTSVLYYFDCVSKVKVTKCYATASANTRHDAAAVWAHLIPLLEFIQEHAPSTTTLHIISDSAGSQYRNLKIYFIITALHWNLRNIEHITWNFTEAGHGKGAPDGVGAVLKRSATNLVKCGKDISDISTFVQLLKDNVNNIVINKVSEYDILEKDLLLPKNLLHFKGTQKVHQIVWNLSKKSMVALRILSCTESSCRILANRCPHGNHLSFHEPVKSVETLPRVRILSDVLIKSADETTISSNSSFVALPIRSPAFSALSELDLPSELQRTSLDNILERGYENKENFTDNVIEQSDSGDSLEIFPRKKTYRKHEF